MTITTTTELRPIADMFHAQLWVHVHTDTEKVHSFVLVSGPRADVEDYAAGKCSLEELNQRWTKVKR